MVQIALWLETSAYRKQPMRARKAFARAQKLEEREFVPSA